MTNIELQRMLAQLPPNLEVVAFRQGNINLSKVVNTYVGNARYLPGNKYKNDTDKVVIEYQV